MQFSYFKTLALPWQAHMISECGVRIAERLTGETLIELYQIDNFYVEVHYRKSDDEILCINSFEDTDCLEPYFDTETILNIATKFVSNQNGEK